MDKLLDMAQAAGISSAVGKHIALDDDLKRYTELVIRDILEYMRPELTDMEVDCFIERYFSEEEEVFDD